MKKPKLSMHVSLPCLFSFDSFCVKANSLWSRCEPILATCANAKSSASSSTSAGKANIDACRNINTDPAIQDRPREIRTLAPAKPGGPLAHDVKSGPFSKIHDLTLKSGPFLLLLALA
jgi:hypothetical protein